MSVSNKPGQGFFRAMRISHLYSLVRSLLWWSLSISFRKISTITSPLIAGPFWVKQRVLFHEVGQQQLGDFQNVRVERPPN